MIAHSWQEIPEAEAVRVLLDHSERFRSFYQEKRRQINLPVRWAHDSTMPEGIDFRTTCIEQNGLLVAQVIRLHHVPARIEDETKIAHELGHILLNMEGFPSIGFVNSQCESLSSAINSMVHDPLVNSRLLPYGFDLLDDFDQEVREDIRQLSKWSRPPSDRLVVIQWMANYTGKVLDWELVRSHDGISEFQEWFDRRYPDIARRATKLLRMVGRIGYDTPEKQNELFREVMRRYRLERFLVPATSFVIHA